MSSSAAGRLLRRQGSEHAPVLALTVTALIGLRVDLAYGVTAGGAIALALAPLWLGTFLRLRWARAFALLALLAAVSGVILTQVNAVDHTQLTADLIARSVAIVQLAACVGTLLWAAAVSSVGSAAVAFSLGLAASIPLNISADPNTWRFTLSIPIGVLALTLISLKDRLGWMLAVLAALAAIGLANDSRSNSAFLLLTAIVLVWQRIATSGSRRTRGWGGLLSVAAAAVAVALLLQGAILEGYFGEVTQQRTAAQIERGGSVLVGGRPELAASIALISRYPFGLGSGLRADYADIQAAKSGMLSIGYDPNNGYVERFMFGSGIELHSVTGDLWVWFGLPGLALALLVAVVLIVALKHGYVGGTLTPLFVYLTLRAGWDLLFSPFGSALRVWPLMLLLAIAYASSRPMRAEASLNALDVKGWTRA